MTVLLTPRHSNFYVGMGTSTVFFFSMLHSYYDFRFGIEQKGRVTGRELKKESEDFFPLFLHIYKRLR